MQGRRVVIVVAIVMGLMAFAATVAPPPQPTVREDGRSSGPAPGAEPAPPQSRQVVARLDVGRGGGSVVRAGVRDTVVLDITGDVVDSVEIPGLGVVEPIDPASPAHIELYADEPGDYPIRLVGAGRPVGELEIRPAP